ncbi:MAG: DNA topoisomerase VI subunit B [Candidatus Methanofastidiosa archaeon]|nr:DNA topoisomerase VI subunit B [Candidatus Methanofastidiosa archaeon]
MADVRNADELFKEFKAQSVSEFFKKNAAMLGYTGKIRSLTTIVHEGVTNSLDACEEAGILPEISVWVEELGTEHYRVTMEDNASGIPLEYVPQVFGRMLAGSKAHRNIQSRGQQGIGVSGAVMFSQVTTGKPTSFLTSTGDTHIVKGRVQLDVKRNLGEIVDKEKLHNTTGWRGTVIAHEAKGVLYNKSRYSPYNYLRMTSIANPHARITFIEPDGTRILFERSTTLVPKPPKAIKPHPYGITPDDLLTMASNTDAKKLGAFLEKEFVRISSAKAEEIASLSGVSLAQQPARLSWDDAERVVNAFKATKFFAPPTEGLRPIGGEEIAKSLTSTLSPEFTQTITRAPQTFRGGILFVVEAGLAYGGKAGKGGIEIIRYANRAPLIFDQGGCAITEAVKSVDWKRYGVRDVEKVPLTVFVNIVSTHVPYTSAGKQALAMEEEIHAEVRYALMDCGRALSRFLAGKRKLYERRSKMNTLLKYVPETAAAIAALTGQDAAGVADRLSRIVSERYELVDEDEGDEGEAAPTDTEEDTDEQ